MKGVSGQLVLHGCHKKWSSHDSTQNILEDCAKTEFVLYRPSPPNVTYIDPPRTYLDPPLIFIVRYNSFKPFAKE